jgi:hypothetical protein
MERFTRKLVPVLCALALSTPAWADMNSAIKAYDGGKYDVALKEFKSQAKTRQRPGQQLYRRDVSQGPGSRQRPESRSQMVSGRRRSG